ncbi:hypothetical protein DFJ73DRAFT_893198 [Zopfochytrium polystomum]|nr:hypothetical protein DFJ73DRAFT_893198 [Zopfochytrium polystomum]
MSTPPLALIPSDSHKDEKRMRGHEMMLAPPTESEAHRLSKACKSFAAVCCAFAEMSAVTLDPSSKISIAFRSRVTTAAVEHRNLMSSTATVATKMVELAENVAEYLTLVSEDAYGVDNVIAALVEVTDDATAIVRCVEAVKNGLTALNDEVKLFRADYDKLSTIFEELQHRDAGKVKTLKTAAIGFGAVTALASSMSAFSFTPVAAYVGFTVGSAGIALWVASEQRKKTSEQARQQADAARSAVVAASQASSALQDLVLAMSEFTRFWAAHAASAKAKMDKLSSQMLEVRLGESQGNAASRAWRDFAAVLKPYRAELYIMAAAGVINSSSASPPTSSDALLAINTLKLSLPAIHSC